MHGPTCNAYLFVFCYCLFHSNIDIQKNLILYFFVVYISTEHLQNHFGHYGEYTPISCSPP